ncbi:MAG: (2Fe-2S)-binding protein [Thermodesulfobacteriota bacterium]|jgi:carbon-monoxide dehydrogenase small subunit
MKEQESKKEINLRVNGKLHTFRVAVSLMLADLIRDELGFTGTKVGCRKGECGACNILVNGELFSSCLYPAIRADGKSIVTIEGLKRDGRLHPIQKAFIDRGAVQCGFCTPGMIMSAKALLGEDSNPSLDKVQRALSGNLCRCGGYPKIFKAVLSLAKKNHP